MPKAPIGGIARGAFRYLRINPYLLAAAFALDMLYAPTGEVFPWNLWAYGFRRTKVGYPEGGWQYNPLISYSGPDTVDKRSTADPNLSPQSTGQVQNNNFGVNPVQPLTSDTRWFAMGPRNAGAIGRMQIRNQFFRTNTGAVPVLIPGPVALPGLTIAPRPLEYPYPAIDPFVIPPYAPEPYPHPIPYPAIPFRTPNPFRSPDEQPAQDPKPVPAPAPAPGSRPSPGSVPADEVVMQPGRSPQARPRPGRHVRRPPQRGREKEQKHQRGIRPGSFLGETIGLITESLDLLDAFFKALPYEVQQQYTWKGSNPWERAVFVAENLQHVKVPKLVQNITSMLLEDAAIGKLGKIGAQANQSLHKHFGIDIQGRLPKSYMNQTPVL